MGAAKGGGVSDDRRRPAPQAGERTRHIGEVAGRVGLSLRTVRYYEEVGLVRPSGRTDGGFRLYTDADIDRLRLVKMMKPLDFSLEEMRDLLELRDAAAAGRATASDLDRLLMYASLASERCERLRLQLDQAERFAGRLAAEARRRRSRRRG